LSEPDPSEPEPHRVTAPAPTKLCGSLRLRLRNTVQYASLENKYVETMPQYVYKLLFYGTYRMLQTLQKLLPFFASVLRRKFCANSILPALNSLCAICRRRCAIFFCTVNFKVALLSNKSIYFKRAKAFYCVIVIFVLKTRAKKLTRFNFFSYSRAIVLT
jgi:hypothetical protein